MSNAVTYFQFCQELDLPIFVKIDSDQFSPKMVDFLIQQQFDQLDLDENKFEELIKGRSNVRVLKINEVSPLVSRQIEVSRESDYYGPESVTPNKDYRIYRYKSLAMIIYSFRAKEWEMGCYQDFAEDSNYEHAYRSVIGRFLSWALAPHGIVGFWGVPVDNGAVLLRQNESKGEVIYLDITRQKLITVEGIKRIGPKFKILKLDSTLRNKNLVMKPEEFLSVLTHHTSYLDYEGLSVPVRQVIRSIAKNIEGLVHPQESFRPRTNLSL